MVQISKVLLSVFGMFFPVQYCIIYYIIMDPDGAFLVYITPVA